MISNLLVPRLRVLLNSLQAEPVPKGEMVLSVELGKPYRYQLFYWRAVCKMGYRLEGRRKNKKQMSYCNNMNSLF
jgi:hypothetical protein